MDIGEKLLTQPCLATLCAWRRRPPYVRCVLHTGTDKAPVQSQQLVGREKLVETTQDT